METLTLDDRQRETIGATVADCPLFRALKPELIPQLGRKLVHASRMSS